MSMNVKFELNKMYKPAGLCTICGQPDDEGWHQSIHKKDCVRTFKGSDHGHKQCLIKYRKYYNYYHKNEK